MVFGQEGFSLQSRGGISQVAFTPASLRAKAQAAVAESPFSQGR